MLGQRMREHRTNVWLINTGWTGGPYGTGRRINLAYTRAMIAAVLHNRLERVDYETHPVFGLHMPKICPGVPFTLLNPRYTWANREAYDRQANMLAGLFRQNFEKYASGVPAEVIMASPKTT
jgi:phosphoenolpyruvate carboxykinase (ATP)